MTDVSMDYLLTTHDVRLLGNNFMQFESNVRSVEPINEIHRAYKRNKQLMITQKMAIRGGLTFM